MVTIPIYSQRSYYYTILLNEIYWRLDFLYNPRATQWTITITEDGEDSPLIAGIPLATGVDCLFQYGVPGSSFGKLMLWNESSTGENMDYDNVGDFVLYYLTPDEDIPDEYYLADQIEVEITGTAQLSKQVYEDE